MARGRQRGSRVGTFLVLAGIGGVLTVAFVAGVWTGRHWPLLTAPATPPPAVDAVTGKRVTEERKAAAPSALPALTFYQELKAPLTAPPPAPKPTKNARPPDLAIAPPPGGPAPASAPRSEAAALPEPSRGDAASASADKATRFTLQVGAYNARQPADTLRAMLAASGHDARVVEGTDTRGAVRYRVQVGVYTSREAAQEARARLASERALSSFVTTR